MANQSPKIYKNPGVAAVLSAVFIGLGQIYNGQIGKGIFFIILFVISILLMFIIATGIVFITAMLWIWNVVDAHKSAKRINEEIASA